MSVTVLNPPPTKRGRRVRLSDAEITALIEGVKAGQTVGDGEHVSKYSTAYQRGQSAANLLRQRGVQVKARAWEDGDGYIWAISPA